MFKFILSALMLFSLNAHAAFEQCEDIRGFNNPRIIQRIDDHEYIASTAYNTTFILKTTKTVYTDAVYILGMKIKRVGIVQTPKTNGFTEKTAVFQECEQ